VSATLKAPLLTHTEQGGFHLSGRSVARRLFIFSRITQQKYQHGHFIFFYLCYIGTSQEIGETKMANPPTIINPLAHLKKREQDLLAELETLTEKKQIALVKARLAELRNAIVLVELS
jgi:hypothetical protein